jgi:hypothetical protein
MGPVAAAILHLHRNGDPRDQTQTSRLAQTRDYGLDGLLLILAGAPAPSAKSLDEAGLLFGESHGVAENPLIHQRSHARFVAAATRS